ncbi:MAG TPA: protein kinase, partial [Polyangiaceae bacterium]
MEVVEGQVLAGKYRIERVLGRGGMGLVVAATHLQLGERVALKFLLPEALGNAEAVSRFEREARAAVRIKSEHVARVSDVGTLDNGAPYMVMEYLQGVDLSVWLAHRGVLPIEQAVEFVLQACEAIAEAHTLGIVHRDLKPANLFVIERPDGVLAVKVLDFGISKTTGLSHAAASMTKTSAALGSPLYMSPEQMQSAKDVDARGDIWALGVVLYELVSGRTPFPGETLTELVLKVVTAPPVPFAALNAQIPAGLEAVIFKCLEKDRAARYASVAELAGALLEFAPRRSNFSVERIGRVMQRAGMSATIMQSPPEQLPAQPAPQPVATRPVATQPGATHPGATQPVAAHSVPPPHTLASWGQTNPLANQRRRAVLIAATLIAVPILVVGAVALLRLNGHGTPLASSAGPVGASSLAAPSAELHPAPQLAAVVEPASSLTAAVNNPPASSDSASSAPAVSASSSARHDTTPVAPSIRSTGPAHKNPPAPSKPPPPAPIAVVPAPVLPAPTPVIAKSATPPPVK